jgi:hypothetical protein
MIPESLENRETELRRAVEGRQFEAADMQIASFCRVADEYIAAFPKGSLERYEILTRVLTVLEWARLMLCTSRAECSNQLDRLFWANRYLDMPDRTEAGLQFDL